MSVQVALAQDTVVTVASRDAYDLVVVLAAGVALAAFVGLLILVAYVLLQVRKLARAVRRLGSRYSADPGIQSLHRAAGNLEAISRTVQEQVEGLSGSVASLSETLAQATGHLEERIDEFNAFLEVVQSEAEGSFVESAATARGVRAGLGKLGVGEASDDGGGRDHPPSASG